MLRARGDFLATEFPEMLTDTFGAPVMNACDTVADVGLAMLRLGDQPYDLQLDSRTTYGTRAALQRGMSYNHQCRCK